MKFYVARHGETEWNLQNRVSGRTDIPMTEHGIEQAKALAENVADLDIDLMLASPLQRTRQTAEIIANRCGIPWIVEDRLIEFNFGIFEGRLRTDPEFKAVRKELPCRYPEGESSFDAAARAYGMLDELRIRYAGENLLLVTHGALARVIRTYFVDMTNEEYGNYMTDNCKCVCYEIDS